MIHFIFKKKMNYYLLTLLGLVSVFNTQAQDIHFSQFDETPLQLNPANAGLKFETRVIANYKTQWQSVNAPFKTTAISGDFRLLKKKKHNLGIGIDLISDNAANKTIKTTQVNVSISGIIKLSSVSKLSAGLMAGYANRALNGTAYEWGNQYNGLNYDPSKPTGETGLVNSFSFLDLGGGIAYQYGAKEMYISANNAKQFTIGASVFHPHQPSYSFLTSGTAMYMKFVFHGDAAIGIKNSNLVLKPSYIIFIQGPNKEITPGLAFQYILGEKSKYTHLKKFTAISLGCYYRLKDAVIATAKFEYGGYAIGLSYDINLSKLKTVSSARGGFEISLHLGLPRAQKGVAGASRMF